MTISGEAENKERLGKDGLTGFQGSLKKQAGKNPGKRLRMVPFGFVKRLFFAFFSAFFRRFFMPGPAPAGDGAYRFQGGFRVYVDAPRFAQRLNAQAAYAGNDGFPLDAQLIGHPGGRYFPGGGFGH